MNYDLLLLDFGGVCLLNPVELHDYTERELGLAPGTFDWMGPLDPSTDPLWQRMIAGDGLTERDYWRLRAEEVGRVADRKLDLTGYMHLAYNPPRTELIRPACIEVVAAARAEGVAVSVFTNDLRAFHGKAWEQQIDFLQSVDQIVDCSVTNILKPDPRSYHRALEITGFDARQVLFVDDQPRNVEGAQACDIDALWFDVANAGDAWSQVAAALGVSL